MLCIDKIKSLFPPYLKYKKNFWLAKPDTMELPEGKRIFIFLAANYGNLGDIAITYAQHKLLEKWKDSYTVVEVPANCTYSYLKGVVHRITRNDIITFVGGGNMGDMYPLYENIRQIVVSVLPNNKIIQFPVTADFSNSKQGILMKMFAKRIYRKHQFFNILSRERKSAVILSNLLEKNVVVVPDIVLTLDYFKSLNFRRGISVCLRNDKERLLSDQKLLQIKSIVETYDDNYEVIDTVLSDSKITLDNKLMYLEKFLKNLSDKKLMITDRLHGMIFAYITGTPAIVFSNSNHKVRECYEWIKDSGYIFFVEKLDKEEFKCMIEIALKTQPNQERFEDKRSEFINRIKNAL